MVDSTTDQSMPSQEAEQTIVEDHIALIYESPEERLSVITPLIKVGLEKGELCLYISNDENSQDIVEALNAENIDVDKAITNGSLILTDKKEVYFKLGRFDPDWTIRVIRNMAELAKTYGFTAMRIITEMTWTQEKVPGVENWPFYEAKMNTLNTGISVRIICQYDRRIFSPEALIAAVKTHPKIVSQGEISNNPFYLPAERLLGNNYMDVDLENMLESIRFANRSSVELQGTRASIEQLNRQVAAQTAARQELETALGESQKRFNEFAGRTSDWAWELGSDGKYSYSSPRVRDILGLEPDEVLGRTPCDLVTKEETERVSAILKRAVAQRMPITALEKMILHRDGHPVYLEMNGTPTFDRSGAFTGFRGIDRDVTGRRASKQAIDESRRKAEASVVEVQTRDNRIQALEHDITVLQEAQAERDAALASMQESLRSSQQDLVRAGEDLDKLRVVLQAKEDEATSAKAELDAKRSEIEEKSAALTALQQSVQDKENELVAVRSSLDEEKAAKATVETSLAEHAQTIERLQGELQGEKDALSAKAEELAQAQEQVRQLGDDLQRRHADLEEAGRSAAGLQEALRSKEQELSVRSTEMEALQGDVRQYEEDLGKLRSELTAKEADLAEAIALAEGIKADAAIRDEELQQAKEKIEQLGKEKEDLTAAVQERDARIGEMKANEESITAQSNAWNEQLADVKANLSMKELAIGSGQAMIEQLKADLAARQGDLATVKEDLRKAELELDEKRGLISELQANVRGREAELADLRTSMQEVQAGLSAGRAMLEEKESELAKAAESLAESEDRCRAFFGQTGVGVARVDLEGHLLEANPKFYSIVGYEPGEIIGRSFRDVTHRDDLVESALMYQRLAAGEAATVSGMKRYLRKLGEVVWVNISMSVVNGPHGLPRYLMAVVDDRTDQMLAERIIQDSEDKEAKTDAYLAEVGDNIARYRSALLGLPTPAAILGTDDRIVLANPAMERRMGAADLGGRPLSEVWPGASPGEARTVTVDGQEVELVPSALTVGGEALGTLITMRETAPPAVPAAAPVQQKPVKISQDLAHDLNDSLTVIMGSVSLAKEYVIPEGRMYNKLKQIESASATARDLAVRLMTPSKNGPEQATEGQAATLLKGWGKILLMDDEESILESTGDLLRYLGYSVEVARDGEEALSISREALRSNQPFDLAILDLAIASGMGGKEACQKLREENPKLKLILTSGFSADPALADPAANGFDAAIPKPYAAERLSRLILDVLSKK
jgi:PAS domain S-box-containing protein